LLADLTGSDDVFDRRPSLGVCGSSKFDLLLVRSSADSSDDSSASAKFRVKVIRCYSQPPGPIPGNISCIFHRAER